MNWNNYFEMMIDWKKLPAYKAEPRIDSLVGFYLKSILQDFLQTKIGGIIPEFPLRLGTLNSDHEGTAYSDRSYKVDFFAIGKNRVNYLVEFKTDTGSRREKQDLYLQQSKALGTEAIVKGVLKISTVSTYTKKYGHLKRKMQDFGLLDSSLDYSDKKAALEIVYVQPTNKKNEKNVISFDWIANWLETGRDCDSFERAFVDTLRVWGND